MARSWTTVNRIAQQWKCRHATALAYLTRFKVPMVPGAKEHRVLYKDLDRLPKMRRCVILPAAPTQAEIRQRCLEIQAGWDEATRRKRRVVSERVLEILHCHYLGDEGDCYTEDME